MSTPKMGRPRVAIVDDNTVVRFGLPLMHPELEVVTTCATVEELLCEAPEVDLVILDLRLSDGSEPRRTQGTKAVKTVARAGYRICLYTDERRRLVLAKCLRAGAHGIVHKSDSREFAADAFIRVAEGETVITRSLEGLAEVLARRGGMPEMTERQKQVLAARARGETFPEIAERLFITEGVAQEHMRVVSQKFSRYMADASPGDIEYHLGLAPGDLADED
ncbi:MAG TPA: response regulator transcription factor [Candidatus Luteococcus avicola]|nr:response regulator transcription factor [Candidatus Luteococcus avicola]